MFIDCVDKTVSGYDKRVATAPWVGIVIHHTGVGKRTNISSKLWSRLYIGIRNWLAKKDESYVSSHFIIGRMGRCSQIIDPFNYQAFHAGKSKWWHGTNRNMVENLNKYFIGIELVGDGNKVIYSDQQYDKLSKLVAKLMLTFPTIHPNCIIGHEMCSPGRKVDPGKNFDWRRFFNHLWRHYG